MKTIIQFSITILSLLAVSFSASAIMLPGWERPVAKASLHTLQAQGALTGIESAQIVFTKKDGASTVTGVVLTMGDQEWQLSVVESTQDQCGSVSHTAKLSTNSIGVQSEWVELLVKDDSQRQNIGTCRIENGNSNSMQALLSISNLGSSSEGQMHLEGVLEPVFTIQSVQF
jgi:hypothetical protein